MAVVGLQKRDLRGRSKPTPECLDVHLVGASGFIPSHDEALGPCDVVQVHDDIAATCNALARRRLPGTRCARDRHQHGGPQRTDPINGLWRRTMIKTPRRGRADRCLLREPGHPYENESAPPLLTTRKSWPPSSPSV